MNKILAILLVIVLCNACNKKSNKTTDRMKAFENQITMSNISRDSILKFSKNLVKDYNKSNNIERITEIYTMLLQNIDIKDSSNLLDTIYDFGNKLKRMKYDSLAIQIYCKLLNENPNYKMNKKYKYILEYLKSNDRKLYATKIIKEILPSINKRSIKVYLYLNLIDIYMDMNLLELASEYCIKSITDIGSNPDILFRYGEISYKQAQTAFSEKKYSLSLFYINKTITAGLPESIIDDSYLLKGKIYFQQNLYKQAKTAFNKVIELHPYLQGNVVIEARNYLNQIEDKEL